MNKKEEMPGGCCGFIVFGFGGWAVGLGAGLFFFTFLQAIGLSIMTGTVCAFVGVPLGEWLDSL